MEVNKIKFISESSDSSSHTFDVVEPGDVTIFVGPNNSGKSLCLSEIESHLSVSQRHAK